MIISFLPNIDRRIVLAFTLLLSLTVQAQGMFVCQLDEGMTGAMEHCCCDGDSMEAMPPMEGGCCDFEVHFQLAGTDPEDRHDVVFLDIQPLLKLPPTASSINFYSLTASSVVAVTDYADGSFAKKGRTTYLSTHRLRI